jgi:RimJ/RimL family protein N-acetyltransferase
MALYTNQFGQIVGFPMAFTGPWASPEGITLQGRTCTLHRTGPEHAQGLFDSFGQDRSRQNWTYMPTNRTLGFTEFEAWFLETCLGEDILFYTIFDLRGVPIGLASYLRITPDLGSIEVGWISMSPLMQHTTMSTEAIYLMMAHLFDDLGYRLYEWKCDSLNGASQAAALRIGFEYEGTFRQHAHYKGRNRDTAWFAIIDPEWVALKARFQAYLDPSNFNTAGQQIKPLGSF